MSFVICHWSFVIGHLSLVIGHWSFVISCLLSVYLIPLYLLYFPHSPFLILNS
ncbi:MAG: hypothetical protein F6K31_29815 [Symploca sp. SIO2G7]|nr:hypothetical protein [Symploca sp. SIO2G7]